MLKKNIGIGCGLITTLYVAQVISNPDFGTNGVQVVNAEETCTTADECDKQINAAHSRNSAARMERDSAINDLLEVEDDWSVIIVRIEDTQIAISKLENQIEETKGKIQSYREELTQLDDDVADLQELIGYRMRLAQRMNNSNEILEYLTESETIVDLFRRVRIINHLSKSDAELMEELNLLIEQQQIILTTLQEDEVDLTAKNQQLALEKTTLVANQKELEGRMASLAKQIKSSENSIIDEEEALQIAEAQKDVLAQVEIPQVVTHENPSGSSVGDSDSGSSNAVGNNSSTNNPGNSSMPTSGKFTYPMASGIVTCHWMCYPNHTGIDISHTSAVPILAAATGVVTDSGFSGTDYGIWVIIEHDINGERYGTLYAHLRDIPIVSVGDTVTQGQQIGVMGSTGRSSGPHLHFEIHPGGWRWRGAVDPRNYLDFPVEWSWF